MTTQQTTIINLKDIKDLKKSELDYKNASEDYSFLEEDLNEYLKEKLTKHKIMTYKDSLQMGYSLGYCQGDGFNFVGDIKTHDLEINIKKNNNHYEHSYTVEFNIISLKVEDKFIYYEDLNEDLQTKADLLLNNFIPLYHNICKDCEKVGYEYIENENKDNVLRYGFKDFLRLNNIDDDNIDIFDFNYSTENENDLIQISDGGNTNFKGLWIEPFNIKKEFKTFIQEINTIIK